MKAGSLPLMWKSGVVLSIISLLFACTAGLGTRPEARTRATPSVGTGRQTYAVNEVDQPVRVITQAKPRYPKTLRDNRITGDVELQYVIDTIGHAEPNSFRVIYKTREEFVEPAKEAILASVFRPAWLRGRPVRQRVQQKVFFRR